MVGGVKIMTLIHWLIIAAIGLISTLFFFMVWLIDEIFKDKFKF